MKKLILLITLTTISAESFSQSSLDSLFTFDKLILVSVKEVTNDALKFTYPGEELVNTIYKNQIVRVVYRSGREELFANHNSLKIVKNGLDWENVSIAFNESETKGLFRLEEVMTKAKGTTELSNMNKVKERAFTKLKMESAMVGGNIVLLLDVNVKGNKLGYFESSSSETNLSGIAYSNRKPDYDSFVNMVGLNTEYKLVETHTLGNNSTSIAVTDPFSGKEKDRINKSIKFDSYINEGGFIYAYCSLPEISNNKFRVCYFDNEKIVLMYRDKTKVYNFILYPMSSI